MALNADEKAKLEVVLSVAKGDERNIRDGIIKALRGENEPGRRGYLWRTLERAARENIRRDKKKMDARQPSLI